jgi:hypothetical protein
MKERLYNLLPAIYRIRDAEQGEPLHAQLGVIEEELRALEQDISGLYEDMFIETCDEWVIPYIGDLLGVHGVHPLSARAGSLRSYVANTLACARITYVHPTFGTQTGLNSWADPSRAPRTLWTYTESLLLVADTTSQT